MLEAKGKNAGPPRETKATNAECSQSEGYKHEAQKTNYSRGTLTKRRPQARDFPRETNANAGQAQETNYELQVHH